MDMGSGWIICLVLSTTALAAPPETVEGFVNDMLKIPCSYSIQHGTYPVCWGRGGCGFFFCNNVILKTDFHKVTSRKSDRYQLLGDIGQGDVSLTISGATKEDEGTYCCRVQVPGLGNDLKKEFEVVIQEAMTLSDTVTGLVDEIITLPCSYPIANSGYHMCWGRGGCPKSKCNDALLKTDGNRVTWRKSDRYQLLGDITQGDVSMTITGATKEDQGTYCCRVEIPGLFNDLKKNVKVEIEEADNISSHVGDRVKLPCKYDVSKGTSRMCWGRGTCPMFRCTEAIVWTDGKKVTWTESEKYKLVGNINNGEVSLTINGVTKEDEGMYCCRVELPGLFNDQKNEVNLEVECDGVQNVKH
ncbi:polymeric immunoglobulin receptor-like [Engystomops pustulosus]|uniref:polymeric immunoglobulin receptor-like n=1 Tax=Engystomops pustulosus TaxID=76066 RepID=UPI003AFAA099